MLRSAVAEGRIPHAQLICGGEGVGKLAFMGSVTQALEFFGVSELKDITKLINPTSENGDGRADEFVEKYNRMCGI